MALIESSIACLFAWSVSLPFETSKTIGLAPFCWGGNFSWSRSLADWLPVPGSERSLLVCEPKAATAPKTATATSAQTPIMTSGRRAQNSPILCSSRATVTLPRPGRPV